jgi:hypothetical protein
MTYGAKPGSKLNEGQVTGEILNDSHGTVDPADTMDTDPEADPVSSGTGPEGNEEQTGEGLFRIPPTPVLPPGYSMSCFRLNLPVLVHSAVYLVQSLKTPRTAISGAGWAYTVPF